MKERLQLKKWLNGITNVLFCLCLLVVILIVLQVFVVTSFKIPSDSMEPSLLAGDRGLVLKSFPDGGCNGWTISEFGPLYIPAKGSVVGMNPETRLLYRNVIEWEQKKKLTLHGDSVLLGDSVIHNYRFCENYYFVSGDKMVNSKDSRYWGLLPEPFIVGRAWLVWKSVSPNTGKMRWKRIFKRID